MQEPGYLPLKADRFTAFTASLRFIGVNLTGRALKMQVRKSVNAAAAALVTLNVVTDPVVTGLRLVNASAAESNVSMVIDKATMTGLLTAAGYSAEEQAEDKDFNLAWDLWVANASGFDEVVLRGPFVLRAGVTQ